MALHIQMSDEALRALKRNALMSNLVSFGVCAGLLLLFGSILYFTVMIIQGEIPAEFISYVPPTEDGPPTNAPVSKELTSKSVSTSTDIAPSVIVAQNAVGAVAAPVSIDTTGDISFDQIDISMDMDLGEGLGEAGAGLGSSTAGGSALEGTFYDLKMTRNGAPSKIPTVTTKDKDGKPLVDANGKPFKRLQVKDQHGVPALYHPTTSHLRSCTLQASTFRCHGMHTDRSLSNVMTCASLAAGLWFTAGACAPQKRASFAL